MDELLLKYIKGDCTEQEKAAITEWLEADPANMKEYLALRKLYDITIWQSDPDLNSQQTPKRKTSFWPKNSIYLEALKIAAIFIVAIFISHHLFPNFILQTPDVAMQSLYVPAGQRAEITLKDGTKVWLNAKTKLSFPDSFSGKTREVKLDGEAFFEVAHDKTKPFIVDAGKYQVKVLGTKFNLRTYPETEIFETSLLEGSVEINLGSKRGVMLKPNERISNVDGSMVISPIDNTDDFLWKDGIINFDNLTFPEIVHKLELYYDTKIEVKNNKILGNHFTGKFRVKDGIEHILEVLQLKNNFSYTIDYKLNNITIE